MTQDARFAAIIVNGALEEMARTSGAPIADILACMVATPNGAAAKRFAELVNLGRQAVASIAA